MQVRNIKPIKNNETILKLSERVHELEELNRDLMGMFENSYDAFAVADGESRLLMLNPAFERVMGLKNADIMGRKIKDLVNEGVTDTAATLKVLKTGKIVTQGSASELLGDDEVRKRYLGM